MNTKLENKIISVAYGDANILTKIKIRLLARRNKEVKKLLDEYSATARKVKTVKQELFIQAPENISGKLPVKTGETNPLSFAISYFINRPLIPAAALIIAVIISLVLFSGKSNQQYSEEEIKLAEKQVKQTIVLVAGAFEKTKYTLEKEILAEKVGEPIYRTTKVLKDYLKGGKGNEKLN